MLSKVRQPDKVFTLDEANRTLPLVSRVLRDIVRCQSEIEELESSIRSSGKSSDAETLGDAEILEGRRNGKVAEQQSYLEELKRVGCECKDPLIGLVDFPAWLDDRVVSLCWRLGEKEISHWHEVDAGFRGRRSVDGVFGVDQE